jgi:hypothetical protein
LFGGEGGECISATSEPLQEEPAPRAKGEGIVLKPSVVETRVIFPHFKVMGLFLI